MNKVVKYCLMVVGIVLLLLGAGFYIWTRFDYNAEPAALKDMITTDSVAVLNGRNIVFFPKGEVKPLGIIFYPGGKIKPEAYAPILMKIAEQGYEVVIVRMPFNLAVFDVNAANKVLKARPDKRWVLAGHSLGGAMAVDYLRKNPESPIDTLILWGAYPGGQKDSLAEANLKVLSIYGSKDKEVNAIDANKEFLPQMTEYDVIEGGNHAQFGSYGDQKGDGVPDITEEEQQLQTIADTVQFLDKILENK